MPPEPKKPIEEMLEASAKERRAAFGSDPKMPNPMRARLHEEIARRGDEERERTPGTAWLQMFWPRLAVAAALATLLVMLPVMWWQKSHPAAGVAMQSAERAPDEGVKADEAAAVLEGRARQTEFTRRGGSAEESLPAAAGTSNGEAEKAVSADELLSKGPAVVAAAAPPDVNIADNSRAKIAPEQTPAVATDALAESKRLADAQSSSTLTKGYFSKVAPGAADQSVAASGQLQPAAPASAAAAPAIDRSERVPAKANARSAVASLGGARQQFAQRSGSQSFRNNAQANRAVNVLNNFQVEQQGSDIRIVDADGSTYTGKFEPISETANRAVAKLKENNRSRAEEQSSNLTQQARFRATGFNVSLKRSLVFEGDYVASPPQAEPLKAEKRADMAPQQQEAARIVGRATVHGETPVEVDAVAVAGPTPAER